MGDASAYPMVDRLATSRGPRFCSRAVWLPRRQSHSVRGERKRRGVCTRRTHDYISSFAVDVSSAAPAGLQAPECSVSVPFRSGRFSSNQLSSSNQLNSTQIRSPDPEWSTCRDHLAGRRSRRRPGRPSTRRRTTPWFARRGWEPFSWRHTKQPRSFRGPSTQQH